MNQTITIVTPTLNQEKYIQQCIDSVINQSVKNLYYIIVDGESTDNTFNILDYNRNVVDNIIYEPDSGQSDAINKGTYRAKGAIINWLNASKILDSYS